MKATDFFQHSQCKFRAVLRPPCQLRTKIIENKQYKDKPPQTPRKFKTGRASYLRGLLNPVHEDLYCDVFFARGNCEVFRGEKAVPLDRVTLSAVVRQFTLPGVPPPRDELAIFIVNGS